MSGDTTDPAGRADAVDAHLEDLEAGCGCAEVWEHLSGRREADRPAASTGASDVPGSEANGGSPEPRSDGDVASRDGGD